MDCSTCGAKIPVGRRRCTECGTRTTFLSSRGDRAVHPLGAEARPEIDLRGATICPRCGYTGEGISYFSRGTHIALLVGLAVLTAGAAGAAGIIYFLLRRDHRVCPRCGLDWGKERDLALGPGGASAAHRTLLPGASQGRESRKTGFSWLLFLLAAMLVIPGIVGLELAPLLLGGAAAGGGWLLRRSAQEEREARRAALIASLQPPLLKLAGERGGQLTVTEVAAELGWTLPRAEKVLESLNDGLRVDSRVTDEGVIVYEFRELLGSPDARRELGGEGLPLESL